MSKRTRELDSNPKVSNVKISRARLWDDTKIDSDSSSDSNDSFIVDDDSEIDEPSEEHFARNRSTFRNPDSDSEGERYLQTLSSQDRKFLEEETKRLSIIMDNNIPLKFKILKLAAPDEIKVAALSMLQRYHDDSENGASFLTAVEQICSIPWGGHHTVRAECDTPQFLTQSLNYMNQTIYGQDTAKMEILEFLSTYIRSKCSCTRVIGLHGPPGTGKTTLIKNSLSHALGDRPFFYVSLGGANDGTLLTGSKPVWKGSHCGRIVEAVIATGCMNPIIYFDELDKISNNEGGTDIQNFLIHLTDPVQNGHIHDSFLGINLDMSKALFVFSYNDQSRINPILLDRIREIRLSGFTEPSLLVIARDFVVPQLCKELKLDEMPVKISDSVFKHINKKFTAREMGVRPLRQTYENLLSRAMMAIMMGKTKLLGGLSRYDVGLSPTKNTISTEIADKLLSW